MIADALAALSEIFTPPFRSVLWKVLGLTLALLVLAVVGLHHALLALVALPYPWLQTTVSILAGLGLSVGSLFLVAPVSALVAGLFVDDLAGRVERDIDPASEPGRPLAILQSLWLSLGFAGLSLGVTLIALLLLLVPGVNAIAFLAANTYLLGRQYFEFAALRFHSVDEVTMLRHRHAGRIMVAGFMIALFVSVPVLNLLTPLFGTALMVRIHKRLGGRERLTLTRM